MRLDIDYTTRFSYADPVRESANELRACPASDDHQQLLAYRVETVPQSRVRWSTDYWGTRVDSFTVRQPHRSLTIAARSTVDTRPIPPPMASPRLEDLTTPAFRDEHIEFLERTSHTDWTADVTRIAEQRVDALGEDVVSIVLAIHRLVGTTLSYESGATYIGVDVGEVLRTRKGVCQDFTHLAIALCRSVGIPARYTSGYLFTSTADYGHGGEETTPVEEVHVQTHAWFEAMIPGYGWWGLDPTNRQQVGPRHVKIGHGRDYDDITPFRGVFSGPNAHTLEVDVHMRRAAAQEQAQQ